MSQQVIMINTRGFTSVYNAMQKFADARHLGAVIKRSWSASARDIVKPEVKQHVRATFGGKKNLASSYGAHVTGTQPFDLRMDVTSRLKMAIPHEFGGTITAKKKANLAIPTDNASYMGMQQVKTLMMRKKGFKGKVPTLRKINSRLRMRDLGRLDKGQTFLLNRNGKKIVMLKVPKESGSSIRKKVVGSFKKQKSGKSIKGVTAVPMFILQRSVRLRKRTNVTSLFKLRLLPRITARTEKNLEEEFMRISAIGAGKP